MLTFVNLLVESHHGNVSSSIVSISYEGSSVNQIRIESMTSVSSPINCTTSCQTNRTFALVFLQNDDIFYQMRIDLSSTQLQTNRSVSIGIINCSDAFDLLTLNFRCDAISSTNECQFQCEHIRNETNIQILFFENGSLNSTKVSRSSSFPSSSQHVCFLFFFQ